MGLFAILCKVRALDIGHGLISNGLFAGQCRHQGAQTNPCRTKVRYLIEFNHRVDALMFFQNILDLFRGQSIKTTAVKLVKMGARKGKFIDSTMLDIDQIPQLEEKDIPLNP